jgi:hypothetical protein
MIEISRSVRIVTKNISRRKTSTGHVEPITTSSMVSSTGAAANEEKTRLAARSPSMSAKTMRTRKMPRRRRRIRKDSSSI